MNVSKSLREQHVSLSTNSEQRLYRRISDVTLAILALTLLWPLLLLIAWLVFLDSPGAILFRQPRLGFGGSRFTLLKFRTMRPTAEAQLNEVLAGDALQRQDWAQFQKLKDDPRLTRCGRWLRRWSLDELPQIFNVLVGDMSLVGPRPILPEQRKAYGAAFGAYIQLRPGITGLWQVSGRNCATFAERIRLDQVYLSRRSLRMDLHILLRTVGVVVSGVGAY
jgi:lipopolysaccharide/colanic/teichoic acid biosynthesis glycosyltransferase